MAKYDLTNLDNNNSDNLGGICSFVFAPKEWIQKDAEVHGLSGEASNAMTLLPSFNWLQGSCLRDSMEYTEEQQEVEAGTFYLQKLAGVVNKDATSVNVNDNALRYRECVVIYKDRNGVRKLIGNKKKAMNFISRLATGAEIKDKTAFYFSFEHQNNERALVYPFLLSFLWAMCHAMFVS